MFEFLKTYSSEEYPPDGDAFVIIIEYFTIMIRFMY